MMPKTNNYEELRYILYNLGGILMNAITSIISLIVLMSVDTNKYIKVILFTLIFVGVLCIISL